MLEGERRRSPGSRDPGRTRSTGFEHIGDGSAPVRSTVTPRAAQVLKPRRPQTIAPQPSAGCRRALRITSFPQLVALAAKTRSADQAALEPMCGWCASRTAGSRWRWSAGLAHAGHELSRKLEQWTRTALDRDRVQRGRPADAAFAESARENQRERAAEADPRVAGVLARFPGARSSRCEGLRRSRRIRI